MNQLTTSQDTFPLQRHSTAGKMEFSENLEEKNVVFFNFR